MSAAMQRIARRLARPGALLSRRFASGEKADGGAGGGASAVLLAVPAVTFALGTWQVQRKSEKEALIAQMEAKLSKGAQFLPHR